MSKVFATLLSLIICDLANFSDCGLENSKWTVNNLSAFTDTVGGDGGSSVTSESFGIVYKWKNDPTARHQHWTKIEISLPPAAAAEETTAAAMPMTKYHATIGPATGAKLSEMIPANSSSQTGSVSSTEKLRHSANGETGYAFFEDEDDEDDEDYYDDDDENGEYENTAANSPHNDENEDENGQRVDAEEEEEDGQQVETDSQNESGESEEDTKPPIILRTKKKNYKKRKHGKKHGMKIKIKGFKKLRKFMLPLLLAYKLKFLTLVPLLLGGLVLIVATTGFAGFFFALFAVGLSMKHH